MPGVKFRVFDVGYLPLYMGQRAPPCGLDPPICGNFCSGFISPFISFYPTVTWYPSNYQLFAVSVEFFFRLVLGFDSLMLDLIYF